jgi:hypothetical protein
VITRVNETDHSVSQRLTNSRVASRKGFVVRLRPLSKRICFMDLLDSLQPSTTEVVDHETHRELEVVLKVPDITLETVVRYSREVRLGDRVEIKVCAGGRKGCLSKRRRESLSIDRGFWRRPAKDCVCCMESK